MSDTRPKRNSVIAFNRDTKIMNVLCNVSIVLASSLLEAVSGAVSGLSKDMAEGIATTFGASTEEKDNMGKTFDSMKTEIPEKITEMIMNIKVDVSKQMQAKKGKMRGMLADPLFDRGIIIVDKYDFGIPKMTEDLDEVTLVRYIALLKGNDSQFTKMFQELMEWMQNLPKSELKK